MLWIITFINNVTFVCEGVCSVLCIVANDLQVLISDLTTLMIGVLAGNITKLGWRLSYDNNCFRIEL